MSAATIRALVRSEPKKLTAVSVANAKANPRKRIERPDGGCRGLYLVIQPNGEKSWAVRYRLKAPHPDVGRPRKLTLEGFPALAAARAQATQALEQVEQGHDPAAHKLAKRQAAKAEKAAQSSLEEAFIEFLTKYTHRRGRVIRESTKRETARLLGLKRNPENDKEWITTGGGVLARWKKIKTLQAVTKRDVQDLVDDLATTAPIGANRTLSALKTMFRFHVRRDNLPASPASDVDDPTGEGRERRRSRALSNDELAALWRACEAEPFYGPMVRLLALTGCRRDEVRGARWSEFDLEKREWLIPAERIKNGVEHLVPITDMMKAVLDKLDRVASPHTNDPLLFTNNGRKPISGLSKIKKRIEAAMVTDLGRKVANWRLHDLRRTFVSGLQELGVVREHREACVNHRSGQSGVAGHYETYEFWPEKQRAFGLWSTYVAKALNGKGRPLHREDGP